MYPNISQKRPTPFFGFEVWKFQRMLRKAEYYENCKKSLFDKPLYYFYRFLLRNKQLKLNFSIPTNVFDAGLNIAHYGTIIVNPKTKVGKNCRLHACTNIGAGAGTSDAPVLGDNVYIGPGAKLFGKIESADNIVIGANAVVNKSFLTPNVSIGGVPAAVISPKGSDGILIKGTDYVTL